MHRRLLALVFAIALVFAACGDDSGGDSNGDRDAVIELLQGEGESPESAACFADELSEFSLADMEAFVAGDADNAELNDAVSAAAEICAETAGEDAPEDGDDADG